MRLQKIYAIVIITSMLLLLLACSICDSNSDDVSNTNYSAEADFSFEVDVAQRNNLELQAINGTVTVCGKSGLDKVKIWGKRIVESDSRADAQEHLSQLIVNVYQEEEGIVVQSDQPSQSYGRNYKVNYNISIPSDWNLDIQQVNGNIELDSLSANIALNQVNGQIILRKVTANLCIELTNGNIYGDIALLHMGSCCVNVVNGQIGLHIPQNTSADFVATVINGGISVHNLILHDIESSPKYLKGRLGDGAGEIELHLVNGIIYVTGK